MELQRCTICDEEMPLDEFPSNGNDGKRKQCKKCMRELNRRWRKENREKVSLYNKRRRSKTGMV